jgi:hypothetical protein
MTSSATIERLARPIPKVDLPEDDLLIKRCAQAQKLAERCKERLLTGRTAVF